MNPKTILSVLGTAVALAGCGGGGGGGGGSGDTSTTTPKISGTAAVGDPIVAANVSVICKAGPAIANTTTSSQGAWSVDTTGQTMPCAVELSGGSVNGVANATQYHSFALANGTVNVTPLTDLLVAKTLSTATPATWFAGLSASRAGLNTVTDSNISSALSHIRNAYPLVSTLSSVHPITDSFSPVAGNPMDDMLEALKQANAALGLTHASNLTDVAPAGAITVTESFYSALVWKFRSTAAGGNSYAASSLVNTANPSSTHTVGSEEKYAFDLLNAERNQCGFGTLLQSGQVDLAAKAHADWMHRNWVYSHYENSTQYPLGFTGYNGGDRIRFQGYTDLGRYGDNISGDIASNVKTGYGVTAVRTLLSAPFHSQNMLTGYRDLGLAIRSSLDTGTPNSAVFGQFNLAYTSAQGEQLQDSQSVLTYPCAGSTGLNYQLKSESPNPVPGRDLNANPLGHPVIIQVRRGNALAITSATMTAVVAGTSIPLRSASQTKTDDTSGMFASHQAYVIPDVPLAANTSYRVVIRGTNAQVPFTKDFTFTTGSGG